MQIFYRLAGETDVPAIAAFVDFWLAGRGLADKVPGSARDYFVPSGRHFKYVTKYTTILALIESDIVGWCVKSNKGVLIHILVAGSFRNLGIGTKLLELADPETIRSKIDQASGDPADFYLARGFVRIPGPRLGKKSNIEMFSRGKTQ